MVSILPLFLGVLAAIFVVPQSQDACPIFHSVTFEGKACDPAAVFITWKAPTHDGMCGDDSAPCQWTWDVRLDDVNCSNVSVYRLLTGLTPIGGNDWELTGESHSLSCSSEAGVSTFKYLVHDGATVGGKVVGGASLTLYCDPCQTSN